MPRGIAVGIVGIVGIAVGIAVGIVGIAVGIAVGIVRQSAENPYVARG